MCTIFSESYNANNTLHSSVSLGSKIQQLNYACATGDTLRVAALLKQDRYLNRSIDEAGLTPLHVACGHMHKGVIEALLPSYGSINAGDSKSPLTYAAEQLIYNVIQPLSKKGAKLAPPKLKSVQAEGEYVHVLNLQTRTLFSQSKPFSLYIAQTITQSAQTKFNFQCIAQSKEDLIQPLGFTVSIFLQYLDINYC